MRGVALSLVVAGGVAVGFGLGLGWLDRGQPSDTATIPKRTVTFAFQSKSAAIRFLGKGWSAPEPWGVWSVGPRAELAIPIRERLEGDVTISIEAQAYVAPPQLEGQTVIVEANGTEITKLSYGRSDKQRVTRLVTVPRDVAARLNPIRIAFNILTPRSPAELGLGRDDRKLGIGLQALTLTFPSAEIYVE